MLMNHQDLLTQLYFAVIVPPSWTVPANTTTPTVGELNFHIPNEML